MTAPELPMTYSGALPGGWLASNSGDYRALRIVDGLDDLEKYGAHYSRRTPGSRTFTGIGQEVVLVHESGLAVWAVVHARTPARRGSGGTRGRDGVTDNGTRWVWRNMLFRRIDGCPVIASELIRSATSATYALWRRKYGSLPSVPLRTEVDTRRIRSANPGYCYKMAGWVPFQTVRHKIYLRAPVPE